MSDANRAKKAKQFHSQIAALKTCPLVQIRFMDHVYGLTRTVTCDVYGRVVYVDQDVVVVVPWCPLDEEAEFTYKNAEYYSIVASAIKSIRPLKTLGAITLEQLQELMA